VPHSEHGVSVKDQPFNEVYVNDHCLLLELHGTYVWGKCRSTNY
jgi:hypothetical protein